MTMLGSSMLIFELLWDITFAMLIFRLAFFYYTLTSVTGFVPGILRVGIFVRSNQYVARTAELIEMRFMLLATVFWAMFIVIKFDIPKLAWMRLAIGCSVWYSCWRLELLGRILLYGNRWPISVTKIEVLAKGSFATCLFMFGLMPWFLMLPIGESPEAGQKPFIQCDMLSNDTDLETAKYAKAEHVEKKT